ncbi:MAG: hypothetical protein IIV23_10950 [Ruminococcus sp.]|nr:hypothetical protein [Ruminococcus sp.]
MKKSVLTGAALLTAAALLFGGCSLFVEETAFKSPAASGHAMQMPVEELRQKYTGYGFSALKTEEEQRLYAGIDEAVNKQEPEDFYGGSFADTNVVTDILELYKDDHPEVFWIDESEPYYYTQDDGGLTIRLHFKLQKDALETARQELENAVQQIVADAPAESSDYQKELFVHDRLIDACTYDEEAVEIHKQEKVRGNEQNAYGALVEGKAVCEGYTRAFQILCSRLGVTCWVIQGQAIGFEGESSVNHIWNCVQLDGDWYHVDATWDDYEDAPAATDRYYYFNLTTAELEKDHIISPLYGESTGEDVWCNGYVPECNSTDYYYFSLNAFALYSLDDYACSEYLAQAAAEGRESCCYRIDEDADFEYVFDEVVRAYAYDWVTTANEINGYSPQISERCKLSANNERRIITLIMEYV